MEFQNFRSFKCQIPSSIGMQSNFHLPQIHFNLRPQIRVYSGEEIQFSGRRTRINEIPACGARSLGGRLLSRSRRRLHTSHWRSSGFECRVVTLSDKRSFDHNFDVDLAGSLHKNHGDSFFSSLCIHNNSFHIIAALFLHA